MKKKKITFEDMGLSGRVINVFTRCNITSLDDLKEFTDSEFKAMRNVGSKTLEELKKLRDGVIKPKQKWRCDACGVGIAEYSENYCIGATFAGEPKHCPINGDECDWNPVKEK